MVGMVGFQMKYINLRGFCDESNLVSSRVIFEGMFIREFCLCGKANLRWSKECQNFGEMSH